MNPRQEAFERLGGAYQTRVLEPSPPAVTEGPWYADDPVARGESTGVPIVSPVPTGDVTWDELCREDPALADWCADRWLGACRRLASVADVEAFVRTRRSWHTLAEHVLAPARYAANGRIGLRFTHHGFGTPWYVGSGAQQLRIEGAHIVRCRLEQSHELAVTNLAATAEFASTEPGAPREVYEPSTPLDLEAPLDIDAGAAALLGDWFGFGALVLERLRAGAAPEDAPARVQLWPEHFDLSFDAGDEAGGQRGTFGASPGDAVHPEPYLYVTHWSEVPPDPFWNDLHFDGASLSLGALVGVEDQCATALSFLRKGRDVLRHVHG